MDRWKYKKIEKQKKDSKKIQRKSMMELQNKQKEKKKEVYQNAYI